MLIVIGVWLLVALGLLAGVIRAGSVDYARPADVIVVLGAGLRPDDTPTPTLVTRAEHGAALWQRGIAPMLICAGGFTTGAEVSEAQACRDALVAAGVPADVILLEERSTSTEENALYVRVMMQEHGWHSAVIVSSAYHLLRADWLFRKVGITVYTSPAPVDHLSFAELVLAYLREVGALHWQVFKDALALPITSVPLV